MELIPAEVAIRGVYFTPILLAALLGMALAWLTTTLLNRFRLSRFFFYPPLAYLAMAVIYTVLIGTFLIPF